MAAVQRVTAPEGSVRLVGWPRAMADAERALWADKVKALTRSHPLPDTSVLVFADENSARTASERLQQEAGVRWVSLNHRRHLGLLEEPRLPSPVVRNLQTFSDLLTGSGGQWHLALSKVTSAWENFPRARGQDILVGVLDSGVDYRHPDLALNIARDEAGLPIKIDALGMAGRVDSCLGLDYSADSAYRDTNHPGPDGNGHGTHVAGIIAAVANNLTGLKANVVGVAPEARIVDIKAMDCEGGGTDDVIAVGIRRAVDLGVRVLNMSIGGEEPAPILAEAIAYGQARGVLFVVAAGNGSGVPVYYPAAYPGVVAVGALDTRGRRASYSNVGSELAVMAPGGGINQTAEGILSTLPTYEHVLSAGRTQGSWPGHGRVSGTSQASPVVAGVAALLLSQEPTLSPDQVRLRLLASSKDMGSNGFDKDTGWGMVDAAAALAMGQRGGERP